MSFRAQWAIYGGIGVTVTLRRCVSLVIVGGAMFKYRLKTANLERIVRTCPVPWIKILFLELVLDSNIGPSCLYPTTAWLNGWFKFLDHVLRPLVWYLVFRVRFYHLRLFIVQLKDWVSSIFLFRCFLVVKYFTCDRWSHKVFEVLMLFLLDVVHISYIFIAINTNYN